MKSHLSTTKRIIAASLAIVILFPYITSAISGSDFKTMNGVHFYDKSGTAAAQSCAAGSGGALPGENNTEKAFWYFVGKKIHGDKPENDEMNRKIAAAILGNLIVESGETNIDPRSHEGGDGPGRGIAQWLYTGRWQQLLLFAKEDGRSEWDLGLQLDFMWHEMTEVSDFRATIPGLKASNSISSATESFMRTFERPREDVNHLDRRIQWANDTYGKYGTKEAPAGIGISGSGCTGSGSIVAIAQAELAKGVLEDPIGCDAGNPSRPGDCGVEVNKYTDSTLEYWCADFVSWVYREAGKPFTGGLSGGWRIPGVVGVQEWMKENGTYFANGPSANPQPGDIYIYGEKSPTEHIGIVEKVEGGDLYTISGNTSTENYSNGVGVGAKVYKNFKSNSYLTGFGGVR